MIELSLLLEASEKCLHNYYRKVSVKTEVAFLIMNCWIFYRIPVTSNMDMIVFQNIRYPALRIRILNRTHKNSMKLSCSQSRKFKKQPSQYQKHSIEHKMDPCARLERITPALEERCSNPIELTRLVSQSRLELLTRGIWIHCSTSELLWLVRAEGLEPSVLWLKVRCFSI